MRIIGGTSRGRRLSGPSGAAIRPTADQVKEALFNILADRIVGVRFLDLFAGTGNIGLEALSRRATQATFVESNPSVCRLLEANVRRCGFERVAEIHPVPVSSTGTAWWLSSTSIKPTWSIGSDIWLS